jgi:hypothetical protein
MGDKCMKKTFYFFCTILISISLLSCGVNLEQDEAEQVITKHFKFPKPSTTFVVAKQGEKHYKNIIKLVREGYVLPYPDKKKSNKQREVFLPTEKGKDIIAQIVFEPWWKSYSCSIAVVQKSLKSIDEILIDEESKEATIKYTTKYEPIEPFYSDFCIDKLCSYYGEKINREHKKTIKLKKYDKGWRVPK